MKEIFEHWRSYSNGSIQATLNDIPLTLEVLTSPNEQANGFMNRPEPGNNFGLYFKYDEPRILGFWMRNVPYDLDLLAFDDNMKLFQVIYLKANDENIRKILRPCRHVVELRHGWVKRNNLKGSERLTIVNSV